MKKTSIVSKILFIAGLLLAVVVLAGCFSATARVRRDVDTTGYKYQVSYSAGGDKAEDQGVQVVDEGGKPVASLRFGRVAGYSFERMQKFNPNILVDKTFFLMTQYSTNEDIFDIREASYIVQRFYVHVDRDLVVLKSEMKFGFSLLLNKLNNQDFELACLYTAEVDRDEDLSGLDLAARAKPWYAKLTYKTILSESFSPYGVAIKNARPCTSLPANWGQMNEAYDEAIVLAREMVRDLERNNWEGLSPEQGTLYKVVANPTSIRDIVGFESAYGGRVDLSGIQQNYRVDPGYHLIHLNLDWSWGKQNSRNRSLEALVLEFERDGVYEPVAVFYFIKSRWAANGLYVLDRLAPGERPEDVVRRGYDLINMNIPSDILDEYAKSEEDRDIEKVARWEASRPPFDLRQLKADFAAVVDIRDVTERLHGGSSGGDSVTVEGPRRRHGTYHIQGDVNAVVLFNALLGEHAVEYLDLGYIQPNGGDGIGFVSTIIRLIERYNKGEADFTDAAALDQRAQESPEMVAAAVAYFRNTK